MHRLKIPLARLANHGRCGDGVGHWPVCTSVEMVRLALIVAGVLMVVATLLHPSRKTATTIVATELRLVAAHVVYTLAWLVIAELWHPTGGHMSGPARRWK